MDVMLDIETFGSKARAVITAIGAVAFDIEGGIGQSFYSVVDARSQPDRDFDPDTVYWWMGQEPAAVQALLRDQVTLVSALQGYSWFLRSVKPQKVWCYGATFDHVILDDAFRQLGLRNPTHYRDQLDLRTYLHMMGKVVKPTLGTVHNALDDAVMQAVWMQLVHRAASKETNLGPSGVDSPGTAAKEAVHLADVDHQAAGEGGSVLVESVVQSPPQV